jgi:DNA mismatch repair protein MSH3
MQNCLQCTPQELATILTAFNKIAIAFDSFDKPSDVGFKSIFLNEIIFSLPKLKEPMKDLLGIMSLKKAAEGRKDTMWNDPERYPNIADMDMVWVRSLLNGVLSHHLSRLSKLLRWN